MFRLDAEMAPVAALGYRGGGAERGLLNQRFITVCLLCKGAQVGSRASQPVPPSDQRDKLPDEFMLTMCSIAEVELRDDVFPI